MVMEILNSRFVGYSEVDPNVLGTLKNHLVGTALWEMHTRPPTRYLLINPLLTPNPPWGLGMPAACILPTYPRM